MSVSNCPDHPHPDRYAHHAPWDLDLPPLTMPEMFARSAREHAASPMIEFLGRTYSYAEIEAEARRFARGLQDRGIAKGDRIGLFLPNVPIYPAAYYGAMMMGAVVVNFSPLYTAEELAHQVEDSGTRLLVTLAVPALLPTALKVLDGSTLDTLVVGELPAMLPRLKGLAMRVLKRGDLSSVPSRKDVCRWDDCLGNGAPDPVELDATTDLALLQYTGGTTGRPKGAMLTHQNLSANARQVDSIDPFKTDPGHEDRIMGVLPLFHVFANTCVLNRTVLAGGCIAMLPRFEAGDALKTMENSRASAFPGVPTMYQALLDAPGAKNTDFSALKICISGGAPMNARVQQEFEERAGARLVEGYGLTESAGVVSTNPYRGENRRGTIGQPLPQTRVCLVNKEDPTVRVDNDEPGELIVAGPQIMAGYWNRPESAADAFVEHDGRRWLRTGDVATIDADGYIAIVDRIKDMIAVGGFKVFPSEVEKVLQTHDAVKEVLVIGVPDDYLGEVPKAFVVRDPSSEISAQSLREWANLNLGKHERLSAVELRDELPKTMIGKLDRKALREEVLGQN